MPTPAPLAFIREQQMARAEPRRRRHRADAIRAMRDCSKSAEFLEKPSGLTLAQGPYGGRRTGAALHTGSAPARRPNPATVTFLNGRNSDISKWWTQFDLGPVIVAGNRCRP